MERSARSEVLGLAKSSTQPTRSLVNRSYATHASHYQIMPLGVVIPRTIEEAKRAIAVCRSEGIAVTPRGGGTSQAGQTVNDTVVIDCSAHLKRVKIGRAHV